jgi:hypothetical protein
VRLFGRRRHRRLRTLSDRNLYDLSDPVYSLMQGARMMGRSITEEHAKDMIEAAGAINARRSADGLARWLGSRSGSANFLASGPSDQST